MDTKKAKSKGDWTGFSQSLGKAIQGQRINNKFLKANKPECFGDFPFKFSQKHTERSCATCGFSNSCKEETKA
jgi:hypothetical protein